MEQKSDEEKEIQQDFGYDYQKYGEQQAFMAASFSEYNALLKDINDQTYIDLGLVVEHLSEGEFPSRPFPVTGRVYGPSLRIMAPLLFRQFNDPNSKTLNVWCVIDTTSAHTCLSVKTLEAFVGKGNVIDDRYLFAVQKSDPWIEVKVSRVGSEFEHANVLGMDTLDYMYLSVIFNIRKKQVSIVDTEIKIEENNEDN
ncbi:unnamed protein product [Caenorhabditis brenneri]